MISNPDSLIKLLQDQKCAHWQLFKTYTVNNPLPIATSFDLLGDNPDLKVSTERLSNLFQSLGPGTYHIRYNTKNNFSRGCNAADVNNPVLSTQNNGPGIGGFGVIPDGYVSLKELDAKIAAIHQEYKMQQLSDQIAALKNGDGAKSVIEKVLEYVNGNPELSKAVGNFISGFAQKFTGAPILQQQTAVAGIKGFEDDDNKGNKADATTTADIPDHLKELSDDDYNKQMDEMDRMCEELWHKYPDFPQFLKSFAEKVINNPTIYQTAKQYF